MCVPCGTSKNNRNAQTVRQQSNGGQQQAMTPEQISQLQVQRQQQQQRNQNSNGVIRLKTLYR